MRVPRPRSTSARSFYPLFPPAAHVNIDYTRYAHLDLPLLPDVLLVPSQLRYFVKVAGARARARARTTGLRPRTWTTSCA